MSSAIYGALAAAESAPDGPGATAAYPIRWKINQGWVAAKIGGADEEAEQELALRLAEATAGHQERRDATSTNSLLWFADHRGSSKALSH